MPLVLLPTETENEHVLGEGTHVFEANMPDGAVWAAGLSITIDLQSPNPGDEDQWETLHTFTEKGTIRIDLARERIYRVQASVAGAWVNLDLLRSRA